MMSMMNAQFGPNFGIGPVPQPMPYPGGIDFPFPGPGRGGNQDGVVNVGGILKFRDANHVNDVVQKLADRQKAHTETNMNLAKAAGVSTDDRATESRCAAVTEQEISQDSQDPTARMADAAQPAAESDPNAEGFAKVAASFGNAYKQFEESLGFKSMRAVIEQRRGEAMKSDGDVGAGDFIGLDEYKTVLSPDGKIIVGGKCVQLTKEGEVPCNQVSPMGPYNNARRLHPGNCRTNVASWGLTKCPWSYWRRVLYGVGHFYWPWGHQCKYIAWAHTSCWFYFWPWKIYFLMPAWNYAYVFGSVSAPEYNGCSLLENQCNSQHVFRNFAFGPGTWNFPMAWDFVRVPARTHPGWIRGHHRSTCCPRCWGLISTLYF